MNILEIIFTLAIAIIVIAYYKEILKIIIRYICGFILILQKYYKLIKNR